MQRLHIAEKWTFLFDSTGGLKESTNMNTVISIEREINQELIEHRCDVALQASTLTQAIASFTTTIEKKVN